MNIYDLKAKAVESREGVINTLLVTNAHLDVDSAVRRFNKLSKDGFIQFYSLSLWESLKRYTDDLKEYQTELNRLNAEFSEFTDGEWI